MAKRKDKSEIRQDSRVSEGRATENRDQIIRNIQNNSYMDTLYIPPEMIPPGMEYAWGTISVRGEPRPGRMIELRRKGWNIVPADRHPELFFADFSNNTSSTAGHIERTGLVLIERLIEYGEIERKMHEGRNLEIMTSMPGTENFLGEPSMPASFTNNTYLTKNSQRNASFGR